jgi:hypothetical protein
MSSYKNLVFISCIDLPVISMYHSIGLTSIRLTSMKLYFPYINYTIDNVENID